MHHLTKSSFNYLNKIMNVGGRQIDHNQIHKYAFDAMQCMLCIVELTNQLGFLYSFSLFKS